MRHPETFFEKSLEAAVIDPRNRNILKKHLPCASCEVYLRSDDGVYDIKQLTPLIDELVNEKILNPGKKGDIWFSRKRMPQREVGIRAIGEPFIIVNDRFKHPAIFIYDGYEGGIGLTKRGIEVTEDWLMTTLKIIEECPCEEGCPSCVQDPQCGSGNQPLDKEGAKYILKRWLL